MVAKGAKIENIELPNTEVLGGIAPDGQIRAYHKVVLHGLTIKNAIVKREFQYRQ